MSEQCIEKFVSMLERMYWIVKSWSVRRKVCVACVPVFVMFTVLNLNWYKIPLPEVKQSVPTNGQIEVIRAEKKGKPDVVKVTVCYSKQARGTWYNIKKSAKKLNNQKLKPGDKFSWLEDIGRCGKQEGYAPGGGVDGLEYGGGICFTATGYFRLMYTIKELEDDIHCKHYSHHDPVWYATDRNDATVDGEKGVDLTCWNESNKTLKVKVKVNESKRTITFTGYLVESK